MVLPPPRIIMSNHIKIDLDGHQILCCQQQIALSPLEFDLLIYLIQNSNRVCTFYELLTQVWGCQASDKDEHLVRLAVSKLRKKFHQCQCQGTSLTLRTVRGRGYCYDNKPHLDTK